MIRIVKNAVPTGVSLTLYPTKDYFDYFKSIGSDDCTLRNDLSAKHLQHPRFFNIRIYANWTKHSSEINRWIGNIYCLDYTKKGNKHVENIIVLDRIQINRSAKFFPISFFKSFMESLSQLLQANEKYTVIGPTRISNYKFINSSYKSYIAGRKLKKFNFETDDKVFECSRYKRFYELN